MPDRDRIHRIGNSAFLGGSQDQMARNHSGADGVGRTQQLVLNDVSNCDVGVASRPSVCWSFESSAFPPFWVQPGQVRRGLVGARERLSATVPGNKRPFPMHCPRAEEV